MSRAPKEERKSVLAAIASTPPVYKKVATPSKSARMKQPKLTFGDGSESLGNTVTNDEEIQFETSSTLTDKIEMKDEDATVRKSMSQEGRGKKSYVQLAHDAISALKDRTGSSQIAIQKYLLGAYSDMEDGKPFRTRVGLALKSGVTQKRFLKCKSSFKVNNDWVKKTKAKQREKDKVRKDRDRKKRQAEQQEILESTIKEAPLDDISETLTQENNFNMKQKNVDELEKKRKKDDVEQLRRERVERLKKRHFPMEDTKLHLEDKELAVRPPDDVKKRPGLPYVFQLVRDNKNTAETPSRCQNLDHGSRGLMPDLLQVYHLFRGDVHYSPTEEALVPEFSLRHLMFAVDEVLNGNAKKARLVPPLISHLFVTCLKLLTTTPLSSGANAYERRLHKDLENLALGLGSASWGEICCQYMEAMERFYTTSASLNQNVLAAGVTDMLYLMNGRSTPDLFEVDGTLPNCYGGYVGSPNSALAKGHDKLMRHDPWNLSGEELVALLRALTDDVLATRPELADALAQREEEMNELMKAKRTADLHFRKIKLAFEGPKQKSRSKLKEEVKAEDSAMVVTNEDNDEQDVDKDIKKGTPREWKPTATEKQFNSAKKAQERAQEEYEMGVLNLVSRTDPIGHDRFHNRVYYFHHDPDILYVEMIRSPTGLATHLPVDLQMNRSSWHAIENCTVFDHFVSSLDIRGQRENELYEAMMGPSGANKSLKRHLVDVIKEQIAKSKCKKDREELERKRQNAILACKIEDEGGGRRSGRFQTQNEEDLRQILLDIKEFEKKIENDETPYEPDYFELTGKKVLEKFDGFSKKKTRRSREKKQSEVNIPVMPCSMLWPTGNIDSTGIVGLIVSEMLNVERLCESLCPWQKIGADRNSWIAEVEGTVNAWYSSSPPVIGPEGCDGPRNPLIDGNSFRRSSGCYTPGERLSLQGTTSDGKRRKLLESPKPTTASWGQASVGTIISVLKNPLLALEERIFESTGLAMAERDAGEADENMSVESDDEAAHHTKQMSLWKKKVFLIRNIPATNHSQVRDHLIDAISAARRAHLPAVVARLRNALLLHQPRRAGDCKAAALAVLQEYGGYDVDEESDDDSEDEGKEDEDDAVPSLLNTEAMMITGSLNGDDMANRLDWIEGVKGCKTLSRFAALVLAFSRKATSRLDKVYDESIALLNVLAGYEKEKGRADRARGNGRIVNPSKNAPLPATEVWADVQVTNDFCMVKLEGSPWWPARICRANNNDLRDRIASLDLKMLSVVGEEHDGGFRIVKSDLVRTFSDKPIDDDLSSYPKRTRIQLEEFLAISRRIIRGHKKASGVVGFVEEKKTGK